MAGEAGMAVSPVSRLWKAAGEAGLRELARITGDELDQVVGGEVQLVIDPWGEAVVTGTVYDIL